MPFQDFNWIVGALLTLGLALGSWMFKVHAKLAVIASKIIDLCDKLDDSAAEHQKLWRASSRLQSRVDTHEVQLSHIAERLKRD